MEFTPFPMFKYSDDPDPVEQALAAQVPDALAEPAAPVASGPERPGVRRRPPST